MNARYAKEKARMEADPVYAAQVRARHAKTQRCTQAREKADPERWAKRLAKIREWKANNPEYRARELARLRKNPINPKVQVNS